MLPAKDITDNEKVTVLLKPIQRQKLNTIVQLKSTVNQILMYVRKVQNHIHIEMFFQIKFGYNLSSQLKIIKKRQIVK